MKEFNIPIKARTRRTLHLWTCNYALLTFIYSQPDNNQPPQAQVDKLVKKLQDQKDCFCSQGCKSLQVVTFETTKRRFCNMQELSTPTKVKAGRKLYW